VLLLTGFFILRFADESVEQKHHEDSADKETERSENGRVVEGIGHGRCFMIACELPEAATGFQPVKINKKPSFQQVFAGEAASFERRPSTRFGKKEGELWVFGRRSLKKLPNLFHDQAVLLSWRL
jgi:hypothetical protein